MLRIGILRGGKSDHEKSLKNGGELLRQLSHHHVSDIYVDKKGIWHIQGLPVTPQDAVRGLDLVYNSLYAFHPEIHTMLELHDVPHTSPEGMSMATLHHRLLAKKAFAVNEIKTPIHREIPVGTDVYALFRSFPMPAIAKYFDRNEVVMVQSIEDLEKIINKEPFLLEEFIPGIKVHVATVPQFRDEALYVLPPVEIYTGRHVAPSAFAHTIKEKLVSIARKIHDVFSLKHYSGADFVVHPKRGIYLIRVHTTPDITPGSPLQSALESVGSNIPQFVEHIVGVSIK